MRPYHWGVHSEVMTLSAHSKAMPSSAYYYQPRSLNNKNVCQRQNFLKGSKSYRLVALSWGLPSSAHSVWINKMNTAILKTPVVSGVKVTQGKQKHWSEVIQTDSQERRNMRCWSEGGKDISMRPCHRGAHSEDLPLSAHYISWNKIKCLSTNNIPERFYVSQTS